MLCRGVRMPRQNSVSSFMMGLCLFEHCAGPFERQDKFFLNDDQKLTILKKLSHTYEVSTATRDKNSPKCGEKQNDTAMDGQRKG